MKPWHIKKKNGMWCAYYKRNLLVYRYSDFRKLVACVESDIKGDELYEAKISKNN